MLDFNRIAEFREAKEEQDAIRDLPYLSAPLVVAGVEVLPMTLRHFTLLSRAGSPWVVGGVPNEEDAALFLWIVSTVYQYGKPPTPHFLKAFARKWNDGGWAQIADYVEKTFIDAPGSEGKQPNYVPPTSTTAAYVHIIAKHYGWSRAEILDAPLIELHQYLKRITLDADPQAITFNLLTDKVRGRLLREFNETPEAEREDWLKRKMEEAA